MKVRLRSDLARQDIEDLERRRGVPPGRLVSGDTFTEGEAYFVFDLAGPPPMVYNLISDYGDPAWYPSELFEVVDASIPPDWVTVRVEPYGDDDDDGVKG